MLSDFLQFNNDLAKLKKDVEWRALLANVHFKKYVQNTRNEI